MGRLSNERGDAVPMPAASPGEAPNPSLHRTYGYRLPAQLGHCFAAFIAAIGTVAMPVAAQQPANSRVNDVQALSQAAYKQCSVEREARLAKTQTENPQALPIVKSLFSEAYCVCAAGEIERQLKLGTLDGLSQHEIRQRILPIYQQCALVNFRRELPSMCMVWYQGLFPEKERITEEQQSSACRCVASATDALLPEDLQEAAQQTNHDYQDWRANPEARFVSARPKSILGRLGQCASKEELLK